MSRYSEWQTGASTACFEGILSRQMMKDYVDAGIFVMELSASYENYYNSLDFLNKAKQYGNDAKEAGLWLRSIHLPFSGKLDVTADSIEDRDFTMKPRQNL